MPMRVGANQLMKMRENAGRMMAKAAQLRGKAEGTVGSVVRSMEVAGSAFAAGMLNGRYGGVELIGVPADLAGGIVAHALAFTGVAGKNGHHLHAMADGLLASYACTLGRGTGVNMREKALGTGTAVRGEAIGGEHVGRSMRGRRANPSTAGEEVPDIAGERLSESELRELAHS